MIGAAAIALAACGTGANALALECSIPTSNSGGGYVTDVYVFDYQEKSGKAVVADGWIMHYHDAPISAKVAQDTDKKLVLTWTLQMTNGSGQQTKMQYRASYFKQNKQLTVPASPGGGYSNLFEGRGKCKVL